MKFLWIFLLVPFFSCVQAGETKSSTTEKPIVLTSEKAMEDKPDTFIPIEDKALNENVAEGSTEAAISNILKEAETSAKIIGSESASNTTTKEVESTSVPQAQAKDIVEKQAQTQPRVSKVETKPAATAQESTPALAETKIETHTQTAEKVAEKPMLDKVIEKPMEDKVVAEVVGKPDHSVFNSLLSSYVSNGNVNYNGFKGSQAKLKTYISDLTTNAPAGDWSRNEKLAYWMNLYNAATINLILDNYPLKSIMDLDGGKPWDTKRVTVDGKSYSLNDIEHKIIRPTFKDARIHFAVNCAAKSCPPISSTAFTGKNVNSELNRITKAFINSSANQISGSSMSISKIFEWYAEDFGNITEYINKYSSTKVSSGADVSYIDYDWALNGN